MKPIGGFFELEFPHHGTRPHSDAIALNTGRACLMVLLKYLSPAVVYVPFYSCDALLQPFEELNIEVRFYALEKNLLPKEWPILKFGEFFLWTNFFGVCGENTERIKKHYGRQALLDDTHSFFVEGHPDYWSFTSARKYFGVPDGAFLYSPEQLNVTQEPFSRFSLTHSLLRRLGRQEEAFESYVAYEKTLNCEIFKISEVSDNILRGVDLSLVRQKRIENFSFLERRLDASNLLNFKREDGVPFCYPYLPQKSIDRNALGAEGIYIPSFWRDVLSRNHEDFDFERCLSKNLLPLPIDHRYGGKDMERMVSVIQKLEK